MTKRYNVTAPRKYVDRDGNEKTNWNRVGVAFLGDKGLDIILEVMPLPEPSQKTGALEIRLKGFDSDDQSKGGGRKGGSGGGDEIPF